MATQDYPSVTYPHTEDSIPVDRLVAGPRLEHDPHALAATDGGLHVLHQVFDDHTSRRLPVPASPMSPTVIDVSSDQTPPPSVPWWRRWWPQTPRLSAGEQADCQAVMRAPLRRPITVVVAQTRGEAGKTVTTFGLGSALSAARGGGVVALDNDEGPGDLADRLERHTQTSIADLLVGAPWATRVELEAVLQHQSTGFLDVLAADPHGDAAITSAQFDQLMHILRTFYRIIVVDSGNSTRAENWQAAISAADVLVVPIKLRTDHVVPAGRMIRGLQDSGVDLTGRLVLVQSCGPGDQHMRTDERDKLLAEFDLGEFPLIEIPTDRRVDRGPVLRWDDLHKRTQAAYDQLGATVLDLATSAHS